MEWKDVTQVDIMWLSPFWVSGVVLQTSSRAVVRGGSVLSYPGRRTFVTLMLSLYGPELS